MDTNRTDEQIATLALSENWNRMHTNESLGRQKMLAESVVESLAAAGRLAGPQTESLNAAVSRSILAWAERVRDELKATRDAHINLGEEYLHGMGSALRQAEEFAAQLGGESGGE